MANTGGKTVNLVTTDQIQDHLDALEIQRQANIKVESDTRGALADIVQTQGTAIAQTAQLLGRKTAPSVAEIGSDAGIYNITSGNDAGQVWERLADGSTARREALEAASVTQAVNLKTGAVDALAQATPVTESDIAGVGNNNYRWLNANSLPVLVNLSQANQQASTQFLASYRVNGQGFTAALLGRVMVGDGVTAGATVMRVNGDTELWLDRPAGANGTAVSVRFREQRWGDRVIPHTTLDGAWHVDDPTGEEIVRAKGFGFLPGNDKETNKAALERALLYMYANRRYGLRLPGGVCACAGGTQLSPNIRVESDGLTIINCQGNDDPIFFIGDSISQTADQLDQQFTQNVASGLHGIIFRNMGSGTSGKGVAFGDQSGATNTAASAYPLKQCGFQGLQRGVEFYANNWCIDGENCFFQGNNTHIEHIGGTNSGENLIWRASHVSMATEWAIRLSGTGCRFTFEQTSFDYNTAGILFAGTGYAV